MEELKKWLQRELQNLSSLYGQANAAEFRVRLDARCYQIERTLEKIDNLKAE